jgi:signal transduction histidine kinase
MSWKFILFANSGSKRGTPARQATRNQSASAFVFAVAIGLFAMWPSAGHAITDDTCQVLINREDMTPEQVEGVPDAQVIHEVRLGGNLNLGLIRDSVIWLRCKIRADVTNQGYFFTVTRSKHRTLNFLWRDSVGMRRVIEGKNIFGNYGFFIDAKYLKEPILVKLAPFAFADLAPTLVPYSDSNIGSARHHYFDLAIVVFLAFTGIYSGFAAWILREGLLAAYCGYALSAIFVICHISNLDDLILGFLSADTIFTIGIIFHFVCAAVLLQFVRLFLNTRAHTPRLDVMMILIICLSLMGIVIACFSQTYGEYMVVAVGLMGGPVIGLTTYRIFRKTAVNYVRIYLFGWVLFSPFIVFYCLRISGLPNFWDFRFLIYNHELQTGMVFEMVLLSVATVMKFQQLGAERAKLRSQLAIQAKAASLETLAGGIAHEINNPLAILKAVVSNLKFMASRKVRDDAAMDKSISTISATVDRIADIVRTMDYLTRNETQSKFELASQKEILESTLVICQTKMERNRVQLNLDVISDETAIFCNRVQIGQVVFNIMLNALYAIKDLPEDRWIKVESSIIGKNYQIAISNGGPKIDASILDRIFDPFFSTKPVGDGRGLGLAISQTIIAAHRGTIYVDRKSSHTKFVINLPLNGPDP